VKLTALGRLYLLAIDDWKAPFEVAAMIGDDKRSVKKVRATLFGLVGRGWAAHGKANDTFKITDAGRSALALASEER